VPRQGQHRPSARPPHAQGDTARLGLESASFGQAVHYSGFGLAVRLSRRDGAAPAPPKGKSGGPLFNEKGDLVGMVVSTLYDNAGQPLNLAHAVPSRTLAGFLCTTVQCSNEWQAISTAGSALRVLSRPRDQAPIAFMNCAFPGGQIILRQALGGRQPAVIFDAEEAEHVSQHAAEGVGRQRLIGDVENDRTPMMVVICFHIISSPRNTLITRQSSGMSSSAST